MAIDYTKLRSLTTRKLEAALKRDGFLLVRKKGATRFYRHPDGRTATLHFHRPGQTLKIGTLQEIIENEARWTDADLRRLGLIK